VKTSMYLNYTSRSLVRGGQRTILAIFCVAVGVMAIVALQLVGLMINDALTSNVRDANGGDISVGAGVAPFKQSDIAFFNTLKSNGTIINFTAIVSTNGSLVSSTTPVSPNSPTAPVLSRSTFSIEAVNPANYPVVTPPTFTTPTNGTVSTLLKNNAVVVTQAFADQYNKKVGDALDVRASSRSIGGRTFHVRIAGIIADAGVFIQANAIMLIAVTDYKSAAPNIPLLYSTVDITTADQAHTDRAVTAIQSRLPLADVTTASDLLRSRQRFVDNLKKFLEIAGLMALLIGGVGIVNTMQVLLSRRRVEIAMLKTTGYRRFDLYLLFGLEAAMLGFAGGVVGASIAIGVSYLIRNFIQQLFGLSIAFTLDPLTIVGGVMIGIATALIFGLLPIVQAANIRPLNVLRELPTARVGNVLLTTALLMVLSVLFCILSIIILSNNVLLGIEAVYGTFIFLAILSVFFGLTLFAISVLPVPERFNVRFLALIVVGVALSVLLYQILPTFGGLLCVVSLLGFAVALLPRSWKASMKMALRNLGRQRARTTTTMLALFVGVFTIGLILVLGQNLSDQINSALAQVVTYNVITVTSSQEAQTLQANLGSITGLNASRHTTFASTAPQAINGRPLQSYLTSNSTRRSAQRAGFFLSGVEGYDVGNNQLPDTSQVRIIAGRNLGLNDAGTKAALVNASLAGSPFYLNVGDTITLAGIDGLSTQTIKIVGMYTPTDLSGFLGPPVLTSTGVVQSLSISGFAQTIFYMKVDPAQANAAVGTITGIVPDAFVFNLSSITGLVDQILNDMVLALTVVASLSLLAGVIIIANAVALAMLERRRELGILKSVGYTSGTILSEVLLENGIVGATSALLAMLLVTLAVNLLGRYVFTLAFSVNGFIVIILIIGSALLAMLTAAIVAWRAVRVRPLEVLRYE
jgi:putative ABC transport system permease protein